MQDTLAWPTTFQFSNDRLGARITLALALPAAILSCVIIIAAVFST